MDVVISRIWIGPYELAALIREIAA